MEKNNSTLKLLLTIFVITTLVLGGFIAYDKFIKEEGSKEKCENSEGVEDNNNDNVTYALAREIVKDKLYLANNFWGAFSSSSCERAIGSIIDDVFCHYGTKSKLEKTFYNLYSKELKLSDVFYEKIEGKDYEDNMDNGFDSATFDGYLITKSGEAYVDANYCRASGQTKELDYSNIVVKRVTDDTIETDSVILVKEDNNWKIRKATIFNSCGYPYEVGK